jgi:hypothetical protein
MKLSIRNGERQVSKREERGVSRPANALALSFRAGRSRARAARASEESASDLRGIRFWLAQRFSAAIKPCSRSAAFAAEVRRTTPVRALHALILAAAVFLFMGASGNPDARFKDLGHRMMCTCGCGQVLLECNHVGCQSSDKDARQAAWTRSTKATTTTSSCKAFVQELRTHRHRRAHRDRLQQSCLDHALRRARRSALPSLFTSCACGRTAPSPRWLMA